jgi:hypothetical protein
MLNLDQWKEDANARPALAAMLQDPILANALEIVVQQGLAPIVPPTGIDIVAYGAMMGFKRDGYMEAVANLRALAKTTKKKATLGARDSWVVDPATVPKEVFLDSKAPLDNPLPPKSAPADPLLTPPSDTPPNQFS